MRIEKRALSLRPTQAGWLFSLILAAMLAGSVNYNNNAGFILVFLLGTMAVISLFHSYRNLSGLQIEAMHAEPVFLGQTLVFPVKIIPEAHPDQGEALLLTLGSGTPTQAPGPGIVHLVQDSIKRGCQSPGNLTLASVYPFGLFKLTATLAFNTRGLVYPARIPGKTSPALAGKTGEGNLAARESGPDDFQGLAAYVPGSPMGRISWKAFSRGQGLLIKDFTMDQGSELLFDPDQIRGQDLELKLSRICSAIVKADKRQIRYGLKLGGTMIQPASGKKHMHRCLAALALYAPDKGGIRDTEN